MDEIADEIVESYMKLQRVEAEGKKMMKTLKRRMGLAKQVQTCHDELNETMEATDDLYRYLYMVEDYQNTEIDGIIRQHKEEKEALWRETDLTLAVGQVVKVMDETGGWTEGMVASEGCAVDVSNNRLKGKVRVSFPGYGSSWDRVLEDGDEIKISSTTPATSSPMSMEGGGEGLAKAGLAVEEARAPTTSGDRKSSSSLIIRLKRPRPKGTEDDSPASSNEDLSKRWMTPGKNDLVRHTLSESLPPHEPLGKIHIQLSSSKLKIVATAKEEKEHSPKKPQHLTSENLTTAEASLRPSKTKENNGGRELFKNTMSIVEKVRATEGVNTLVQRDFNLLAKPNRPFTTFN